MAQFYLRGLLLLDLLMIISENRGVSTVIVSQEKDAVLPCSNVGKYSESSYRVRWLKDGKEMVIPTRPPNAEHVKWEPDRKVSLLLMNVQKSDEGLYRCEIWHGWERIHVKNISLKIKDCKSLQKLSVGYGTSFNLSCSVDMMTSAPQGSKNISWVMLRGGNPVPINSPRVQINGPALAFQSVNYSDGSWYRCSYLLEQDWRCYDINVQIQASTAGEITPNTRGQPISGAAIAVAAAVIIAIAVASAMIGFFIHHRRSTQRGAQQTQRCPEGIHRESFCEYEVVAPRSTQVHTDNSLYDEFQEDNLHCFHY